jgi:hypothetical protein
MSWLYNAVLLSEEPPDVVSPGELLVVPPVVLEPDPELL